MLCFHSESVHFFFFSIAFCYPPAHHSLLITCTVCMCVRACNCSRARSWLDSIFQLPGQANQGKRTIATALLHGGYITNGGQEICFSNVYTYKCVPCVCLCSKCISYPVSIKNDLCVEYTISKAQVTTGPSFSCLSLLRYKITTGSRQWS